MGQVTEADTKTLILDAAEQAFADLGFDAASLRHIISVAGVNLAAVHYHFGSKEGLIEAVFARRMGPLAADRLGRLDALEAAAGGQGVPLEAILEAFVGPALRMARSPESGGPAVVRLAGRILAEPSEALQRMVFGMVEETARRFLSALGRALPSLSPEELRWRFEFAIGCMAHVMCDPGGMRKAVVGLPEACDLDELIGRMVAFLAAGFRSAGTGGKAMA